MNSFDQLAQIALALLGVVGLVVVLGFVAKRLQVGKVKTSGLLQVVDTAYLGPKERLLLVQIDQQQVLVGITAQSMTRLAQFASQTPSSTFADRLAEAQTAAAQR